MTRAIVAAFLALVAGLWIGGYVEHVSHRGTEGNPCVREWSTSEGTRICILDEAAYLP